MRRLSSRCLGSGSSRLKKGAGAASSKRGSGGDRRAETLRQADVLANDIGKALTAVRAQE